ncbi:MAG: DUF4783 domain-containing protein [Bacteroidia bacterium]|nr:DUF4783 domain-containing protein [Bacteroidia bacterium]
MIPRLGTLQTAEQTFNLISEALQKGDAAKLSLFFDDQLEVYTGGTPRIYSNVQAKYVMQEFFQKNPPRSFMLLHRGRSDNILYGIGSYVSYQGRWDVSFFLRFDKTRYVIEQLRFELVQ